MSRFTVFGAAALLGLAAAGGAVAEDKTGPTVHFNLLDIEGLVVGTTMTVDAAYGEKNGVPIKTPFSFLVPTGDDLDIYVDPAHEADSTYIKVTFATKDQQFVENVQFVPMTVAMGDREARMRTLADVMTNKAYPMVIAPYPENKYIGWRETTVAGYDAVEVLGEYLDPKWGHMYARIVGYLNPDAADSVFAIANIAANTTPIEDAAEFPRTRTGVAIEQFKFLKPTP